MAGKHYLNGCAGHFSSLYCFLFVSLENRVARNFLRVLFLVIFPAIREKKVPAKRKIYILPQTVCRQTFSKSKLK